MSSWIWVLDSLSGPFHPFGGAVDIIVVQQPDGSFKSSPWYVRFGKFQGVLKAKEKVVNININGVESDLQMFLNHRGEAYFLMELDMEEGAESILSPSSSGEDTDSQSSARRSLKSKSYNYDSVTVSNGKVLGRTGSRRSRIMGFVFGRRSMEEQFLEEESGDSVVKAESLERAKLAADLLDVKWSTNLPSNRLKKDDSSSQNCRSDRDEPETIVVKNDLEMSCFVSDSTQIETLQNENTFVSEVDTVSTVCQVQDEQNIPAETTEISSPEVSPEDQLIFGDLDEDVAEGFDSNNGSDSHPDIVQENLDNECDDSIQNRREKSDNINIPRINKVVKEVEVETMMNSLPVIRSHRSDFDGVGVDRSFGRSLDSSSSAVSKWMMLREDVTSIIKSDLDNNYKVSRAGNEIEDAEVSEVMKNVPLINPAAGDPLKGSWGLWPFRRSGRVNVSQPALDSIKKSNTKNGSSSSKSETNGEKSEPKPNFNKNKKRTTTPTSEQLASLNLKEGNNKVTFMYSTSMWGKQQVDARIYLWRWDTRIVISDVDGTITKSDVLGQFMPLVGKDWSQTGVAHLFSAIKENGYQLLFLSARAISQAFHTRQFLVNLKQDGKALPDGPVVISPNGLFPSLFREVIRRAPHEFKITCLEDIRALFPSDRNPFYAGFGNRDTDEISYVKVGIPKGKIFIINPKGEVAVNRRVDTKSYSSLHALVHGMFPPVPSEQEDFNSWNYWRLPPPGIDI